MDKIATYALALWHLDQAKLLADKKCKNPVKEFIRQASEDNNYHATAHYRSAMVTHALNGIKFASASKYHKHCSPLFAHEHIVPVEVIYTILVGSQGQPVAWFDSILRRFAIRATITKGENNTLPKSTMPKEFYDPTHELYQDPLARYLNTIIVLQPRPQKSWV